MTPNHEHEARLARDRSHAPPPPEHGWRHPETGQVFSLADLGIGGTWSMVEEAYPGLYPKPRERRKSA